MLPSLPLWDAAHPLIVHLPIGILFSAWVLVVCAMFARRMRQPLAFAALLMILMGTIGGILATASGDAAERAVTATGQAREILREHEQLAHLSRNAFILIACVYGVVFGVVVAIGEKFRRSIWVMTHLAFLALYAAGLLALANAGHLGGRLVHEFGIQAPLAP